MRQKESRPVCGTQTADGKGHRQGVNDHIIHETARVADACRHISQAIADEAWRDPEREGIYASAAINVWQSYRHSLTAISTLIQAKRLPASDEIGSEASA